MGTWLLINNPTKRNIVENGVENGEWEEIETALMITKSEWHGYPIIQIQINEIGN